MKAVLWGWSWTWEISERMLRLNSPSWGEQGISVELLLLSYSLQPHGFAAHQASLFPTISQSLLKFMSIESVMLYNHFILCYPLLLLPSIFPNIRAFSNELALYISWPKCWNFSFSISPSNEYSELISFSEDWLVLSPCYPRDSQEASPATQFKSINSSALSLMIQLSHLYLSTGETQL